MRTRIQREIDEIKRTMSPAAKVHDRFLRRCHKRGVWEAMSSCRGRNDPIHIIFWRSGREVRLLNVMPGGELVQRADHHETSTGYVLHDPHNVSCYDRWFWQELMSAGRARRRGWIDEARACLDLARRFRRHAEAARDPEPVTFLEAAE